MSHSFQGQGSRVVPKVVPHRAVLALGLAASFLAVTACGGAPEARHAVLPAAEAQGGLGRYSLALAKASLDVLSGRPAPDHLSCKDAASDWRVTDADAKLRFRQLGASPTIVMSGVKLSLSSPAKKGTPASEVQDVASADLVAFLHARTVTGPNEAVAWSELRGYVAGMEKPHENRAPVANLIAPLARDLAALGKDASEGCTMHLLDGNDLGALPYPLGDDERDVILSEMKTVARQLPKACKAAATAAGPWEVHFHHVDAVFRGEGRLAKVRARLRIDGNAPCLGPVEVMQIVQGG